MADSPIKEDTQPFKPVQPTPEPYYSYPGEMQSRSQRPPRRGSGIGCWLVGLMTAFLVLGLVVAALFLPPFSLGEQLFPTPYAMLNAQTNGTQSQDARLKVIVPPENPGTEFGVLLDQTTLQDFTAGSAGAVDWTVSARSATPPYLALQSSVYSITTTGTAPEELILELNIPSGANRDLLDMYGWNQTTGSWTFIPAQPTTNNTLLARVEDIPSGVALFQASPLDPTVQTTLDFAQTLAPEVAELATIVSPVGMQPALPNPTSTLVGNLAPGFDTAAGYAVMPVIRNFSDPRATDPDTVAALLGNQAVRSAHALEIATFVNAGQYDGVFIDYRDLPAESEQAFTAFIRELNANLESVSPGLKLGVVLPQAENADGVWETGAYNWREIGSAADYVKIDFTLDPMAFAPGGDRLVEAMLRWAVGEVSRYKILGGLSALSVRQAANAFNTIGYDEALSALGDVEIDAETTEADTVEPGSEIRISLDGEFNAIPGVETTINAPFVDYEQEEGDLASRMWLTTAEALRFRMDRLTPFVTAGVAFDDLLADGLAEGVLAAVLDYKLQVPIEQQTTELALAWRIEGVDGTVTEFTTSLNEDLVVTLDAPDGNYAVNVEVVGGSASSARSGDAIALFAPTPTPTPQPTATPTPTPTPTPTLAPIVPTAPRVASNTNPQGVPAAPGGPAPVAPGAGSIAAGFEYGGHVASLDGRSIPAMQSAGMTWVKFQVRAGPGGGGVGQAQAYIASARGAGFKVLLGVVGAPGELAAGGGGYISGFAQTLGQIAAAGPDAIEIWNEPNLSREWPEGQISGANYTALLREGYNAIKAANPNVIVISGAPAPTGAEAAFPGRVVNDDNFLRQMVEAGAMSYLDCVGAHYNEGIVSARATSGDPRDNYYTRYLPSMIQTYRAITGGQKPLCFTELGYLTSEGFGPLPSFFAWAQNVTVAQQAAWLAEAASVSSQNGVRLMIVWNVDFTNYGDDPMAGFAIIRPDGSCPACQALRGAR
ncbi:MAG: hypothetical protein SF029_23565 [bacterium]|nr:hypothetical protein [bacterium]